MNVSDVMTRDVVSVRRQTPIKDVSRLLLEHRISGVPVVEDGLVVGVISDRDILYKERAREPWDDRGFFARLFRRNKDRPDVDLVKMRARTAGEAMTSPAITIRPRVPLSTAAALMLDRGINRLPVVDDGNWFGEIEGGKLVGIVTHADLVRAFARSDDHIAADIHDVLGAAESIPEGHVRVEVNRGEVTLEGIVDWKLTAEGIVSSIRQVPGVVAVDSRLEWRETTPTL